MFQLKTGSDRRRTYRSLSQQTDDIAAQTKAPGCLAADQDRTAE